MAVVVICPLGSVTWAPRKPPVAETPQASLFPNPHHNARAGHHSTLQRRARSLFARGFFFLVSISVTFWACSNCVFGAVLIWCLLGAAPIRALFLAAMARKLRSSSRPSTPVESPAPATVRPSSAAESSRPRKLRRTGHNTRVASDPPQGSQSHPEQFTAEIESNSSAPQTGWTEPPVRPAVPSYMDSPWSAMSSDTNPVLSTMRPLGSMPTTADLRKVGLEPSKPATPRLPLKEASQIMQNGIHKEEQNAGQNAQQNGDAGDKKSKSPDVPVEEPIPVPAPAQPKEKAQKKDHLAIFSALPVPSSDEFDVDRIKDAVKDAVRQGVQTGNKAVIRTLLNVWENTSNDSSMLSILDGICRENPTRRETSAFKTVIRAAWDESQHEDTDGSDAQPPAMTRTRSASSVSSLSSAKSLDAETFAPVMTSATSNTRSRTKGKQAKITALKPKPKTPILPARRSAFPSNAEASTQRKRAMEINPDFSEEAVNEKRDRLQPELPELDIPESKVRSSLALSNFASPGLSRGYGSRSNGIPMNGRGQSGSRETSEAPDNQRIAASYVFPSFSQFSF